MTEQNSAEGFLAGNASDYKIDLITITFFASRTVEFLSGYLLLMTNEACLPCSLSCTAILTRPVLIGPDKKHLQHSNLRSLATAQTATSVRPSRLNRGDPDPLRLPFFQIYRKGVMIGS